VPGVQRLDDQIVPVVKDERMPRYILRRTAARTALIALWLVCALPRASFAQQTVTFDGSVTAESRAMLVRAESLIASNQGDRAYQLLSPAETELAGNPYFDYLLGVAALDSGRFGEAIFSLRRSVAVAPRYSGARMELGRAYFESGDPGQARALFVSLLDEDPPPGVRDVLRQYIDAIDHKPATPGGRFSPYFELHAGHDSNANGSTSNQQFLGFTLNPDNQETESPFAEVGAGFTAIIPGSNQFAWIYNGRLGHRENTDASFMDATTVNGFAGGAWQHGPWFGRAGLDAYWASRDGNANEHYTGMDALFGNRVTEQWDITLGLRGGAQRFDSSIAVLDVDRLLYTLGVSRRFSATSRLSMQVIGGSDSEKQSGSPYGNSKFGGRLSWSSDISRAAFLHVSVGSLTTDFDGPFFGVAREDTQTTASLQLEFRNAFTDGLTILPGLRYVDNESDVALYEYDRTEIGLLIRWAPQ
jgi:tetratricopeptide (TPR) repeat protein